ncbi:MAG: hypothetical protein Q8Q48_00860 [Candidatus Staskawiczbacteria bacterium]|nr:hypothetical protein [Candidatus Staskawiczbacteria bacterium]
MKLVIKVGEATVEVEGQGLKATKIVAGALPVEITEGKSAEEGLQEIMDKLSDAMRQAARITPGMEALSDVQIRVKK